MLGVTARMLPFRPEPRRRAGGRRRRRLAAGARGVTLALLLAPAGCGDPEQAPADPTAACEQGDEQRERHATDCLCCHADDFTVAGSVERGDPRIRAVLVRDAAGQTLAMTPNAYDNFFLHEPVAPPLEAWILGVGGEERRMRDAAPHGSCNRCHREGVGPGPLRFP